MSPGLVPSGKWDVNDLNSNIRLAKGSLARVPGGEEDTVSITILLSSRLGAFMDEKVLLVDGGRLLVRLV